jgi:hypothetical protein
MLANVQQSGETKLQSATSGAFQIFATLTHSFWKFFMGNLFHPSAEGDEAVSNSESLELLTLKI